MVGSLNDVVYMAVKSPPTMVISQTRPESVVIFKEDAPVDFLIGSTNDLKYLFIVVPRTKGPVICPYKCGPCLVFWFHRPIPPFVGAGWSI